MCFKVLGCSMMCQDFPETLKWNKPSPEVGETGTWKIVPSTRRLRSGQPRNSHRRGGQRWFDHHFRPAVRVFWETKKKEMQRDMWTTNHNFQIPRMTQHQKVIEGQNVPVGRNFTHTKTPRTHTQTIKIIINSIINYQIDILISIPLFCEKQIF